MSLHHLLPPDTDLKAVAEELDITEDYLRKILRQRIEPGWRLALRICEKFPLITMGELIPALRGVGCRLVASDFVDEP